MRKSLWILGLLLVTIGASAVRADSFTITLHDGTSSTVDGTGSFNFSGGTFSDFNITILPGTSNAITFNMTAAANSLPLESHGCDGGMSISVFTYLTNADCQHGGIFPGDAWNYAGDDMAPAALFFASVGDPLLVFATGPHLGGQLEGVFVVTQPEPSSVALMPLGIAFLLMMRKRMAKGLRRTA